MTSHFDQAFPIRAVFIYSDQIGFDRYENININLFLKEIQKLFLQHWAHVCGDGRPADGLCWFLWSKARSLPSTENDCLRATDT
jgi:hypothetical protein